jgi:hypothetical protein
VDAVEVTRVANVAVAVVGFVWLLWRAWSRRNEYPPEVVILLQVLAFYVFGLAYGTAEILWFPEVRFRAFVYPVANVALLVALAATSRRHWKRK